ncbi:hypothetical protein DMH25_00330 [Streptomyces sp. WAC 01325]|uniref:hypothetical protein n=1 Tax=Streptomyces sp. WAC 01325 TaxID=2203202 RepID=UPI000F86EBC7|nr:hypothetical protein [Streptomyces sp. WAC 01325]RSN18742.1 hypothetical protein DMH25_00330 [Streptomyces sp. WAC 01325]
MLEAALAAMAAAGGTAVVQSAGTDTWRGFRPRAARLAGRGDQARETAELQRLDRSAAALEVASTDDPQATEHTRIAQEASWQNRFEALLESTSDPQERTRLVESPVELAAADSAPSSDRSVSGNSFYGPTAIRVGDNNQQDNRFGRLQ